MISTESLRESAVRRSCTYWLFARCFGESPSRTSLEDLATEFGEVDPSETLAEEASAFGNALRAARDADTNTDPDVLAIEFTRLFGGISEAYGAPPPFESVAREGLWGGDTLLAVAAAYAAADIAPLPSEGGPLDHVATELRFLAIACYRESEAWRAGDTPAAMAWVKLERDFLDQHLLCWMPDYCKQIADMARTPFYRTLLALAPRACVLDREDVDVILELNLSNDEKHSAAIN